MWNLVWRRIKDARCDCVVGADWLWWPVGHSPFSWIDASMASIRTDKVLIVLRHLHIKQALRPRWTITSRVKLSSFKHSAQFVYCLVLRAKCSGTWNTQINHLLSVSLPQIYTNTFHCIIVTLLNIFCLAFKDTIRNCFFFFSPAGALRTNWVWRQIFWHLGCRNLDPPYLRTAGYTADEGWALKSIIFVSHR